VEEDGATAGAVDVTALRRALVDAGWRDPALIEVECRRILAAREVRSTLAAIHQLGAEVEYRSVDVRDAKALGEIVRQTHELHGRLDGVIHGAGVVEDRRFLEKTVASFERVFDTKVGGALALAEALPEDVGFVVLFSSVSGMFGNRGQVDYAAASEALATIARWLDRRVSSRVVAVDWGPWAGGGMVSPELEREFARRGIGLLDPDEAVDRLLCELRSNATDPEVVVMRAQPACFGPDVDRNVEDASLATGGLASSRD
jgi:NAD(P)-dependent dehydrogenase (short-subunit alcohol dehydrogenase family)